MKGKSVFRIFAIFLAMALLMACAPKATPTPTPPPPVPKPSGVIQLYTSESEDKVNEMVADFNLVYPDVTVNVFRSGTGEVTAKLQAEMQAGEINADVIWFADIDFFKRLGDEDRLLAYNPVGGERAPAIYHYEGGKYHEVRLIFNVVAYNTSLVTEPPTSWMDLANPKYRSKVAMPSPFYSGAAFSHVGTFANLPGFGWDYYQKLKENDAKVERSNGAVSQKLAAGEYALVQVVDFMIRDLKGQGSTVDHIWPAEGALLVPTPIGIIKTTKNAAAAKAFLDYMYTSRAQSLFVQQGYIAVLPEVSPPKGTPDLSNLKVIQVDQAYINAHREEIRSKFAELFGGG